MLTVGALGLAADFNGDGIVNGNDLLIWEASFGTPTSATYAQGDSNGDGDVDGGDFLAWQTNFGTSSGAAGTAVPEPGSCGLTWLSVAVLGWLVRFRIC